MRALLRLVPYLRESTHLLAIALLLGLLGQACQVVTPKLIQHIVAEVLEEGRYDHVGLSVALMIGLAALRGLLTFAEIAAGSVYGQRCLRHLRRDLYDSLCRLSFRYFDRVRTGQVLARVTSDFEPLGTALTWGVRMCFRNTVLFIGVLAVCLSMNWKLALIGLAPMPLLAATAFIVGLRIRPAFSDAREQLGVVSSFLQENLQGIRVVQTYCRELEEIRRFTKLSDRLRLANFRAATIDSVYYPLTGLWAFAGSLLVLFYGGHLVMRGALPLSEYIAFEAYVLQLALPMRLLGFMVSELTRAGVAARRIFHIMDQDPDVPEAEDAVAPGRLRGRIEFEGVTFAFEPGRPVLEDLSFTVEAGETVGILGATGSGKSSLAGLVPRFYDPDAGTVRIDGVDVRTLRVDDLRRQVGVVFQDPFLFSGTIRENIAFGKPDASDDEIEQAARQAAIHDFVAGLEKGYQTDVGEQGSNLSGGQRQRLSIARALLIDPRILILDDCTSSVDTYTEHRIQQALEQLRQGRTTLIVAQRPSSVATADRVLILERGRLVEQGPPAALAADPSSYYSRLFDLQRDLQLAS